MSDLVTVPADAIPGLLGVGAVLADNDGRRWVVSGLDGPRPVVVAVGDPDDMADAVWDEWGEHKWPPLSRTPIAFGLHLILHDPDDPDVSAAGMARAWRALKAHSVDFAAQWLLTHGDLLPPGSQERAAALRTAILAAAGRDAG
jgi:hypothetical protein